MQMVRGEMSRPVLNRLGWDFVPLAAGNKRLEGRKTLGQKLWHPGGQLRGDIPSSVSLGISTKVSLLASRPV